MTIFQIIILITIFLHIVATIIGLFFVLPLQIKEARTKNGLKALRRLMLSYGLNIVILSILSVIVLSLRFFITDQVLLRYTTSVLVIMHGLGFLGLAITGYLIYHQQYNEETRELHERIDELGTKKVIDLTKGKKKA